jgi:hypothetical protein
LKSGNKTVKTPHYSKSKGENQVDKNTQKEAKTDEN